MLASVSSTPEFTLNEHQQRRALVIGRPLGTPVAGQMCRPFDLDVLVGQDILGRIDEVADNPATPPAPSSKALPLCQALTMFSPIPVHSSMC